MHDALARREWARNLLHQWRACTRQSMVRAAEQLLVRADAKLAAEGRRGLALRLAAARKAVVPTVAKWRVDAKMSH